MPVVVDLTQLHLLMLAGAEVAQAELEQTLPQAVLQEMVAVAFHHL